MEFLIIPQLKIFFQLFLAVILGGIIGFEREYRKRAAGLRTHSLVCLGSALFTITAFESLGLFLIKKGVGFDPSRIIASVVMGIGFLGAGLIVVRKIKVEGLTTAAGIWVVAAIGVAVGLQLYLVAIFTTLLVLLILIVLRMLEEKYISKEEI